MQAVEDISHRPMWGLPISSPPMNNPPSDKPALRRIMKERRAAETAKNPSAGVALRDLFLKTITLPAHAVVAGYITSDNEIDPAPLMEALHRQGHKLALPVGGSKDQPLLFRHFTPGDALVPGRHGIAEPAATISTIEPDVVLVPLLAFDSYGNRLGRGGGHYDRALILLRQRRKILAIGLALSVQQMPIIPTDSLDARLDKIVTETEAIEILKDS